MNCGRKAKKNTAIFGLLMLDIAPVRNSRHGECRADEAAASCALRVRSICSPSQAR